MTTFSHSSSKSAGLAAVAIVVLVGLVYGNSLDCAFHFDDYPNILDNEHLRIDTLSPGALWKAGVESPLHRPVAYATFALNYFFGGYDVRGYHLVNVAVHALTAMGFFFAALLFLRLPGVGLTRGEGMAVAALSAGLWAVNPLHVSAVTYVVQRMALLATLFCVWSGVFLLRGMQTSGWKKALLWGMAALSFILGVGSKETAIALPVAVVAVGFARSPMGGWRRVLLAGLAVCCAGLLGVAVVWGPGGIRGLLSQAVFADLERLLTVPRSFFYGLGLFLAPLPHRLSFEHDLGFSTGLFSPPTTAIALVALVLLVWMTVSSLKRGALVPLLCLTWLLVPSLSELITVKRNPVFEHRLYLPGLGVVLLLAFGAVKAIRGKTGRRVLAVCALCLLGVMALGAHARNEVWKTPVSLGMDSVAKAPGKFRAYPNLIKGLVDAGRVGEAEDFYRRLASLQPAEALDHYHVGMSAMMLGRYDEAADAIVRSLDLSPDLCAPRQLLAEVYAKMGNLEAALSELRIFNKVCGNLWALDPRIRRAGAELAAMAEGALRERIARDPADNRSRFALAGILLGRQQPGKAAELLRTILETEPGNAGAWSNLGFCLFDLGDLAGAEQAQRKALALAPGYHNALYGLARVLEKQGRPVDALDYFEQYLAHAPPRDVFREAAKLRMQALKQGKE